MSPVSCPPRAPVGSHIDRRLPVSVRLVRRVVLLAKLMSRRDESLYRSMCKFRRLINAPVVLFSLLLAFNVAAQAENQSYLPLTKADLGRPFALKYLGAINPDSERQLEVGVSTATLKYTEEGELLLTGRDRAGDSWQVFVGGGRGVEAYEADLDHDGLRDLVLVAATGGNGLAPSSHLVAVTFESDGRPVRFEAEGYFDAGAKGLFDLRDLNGDGRAELIFMNFSDGYWITNLYTARNARWRRIKGRFGSRAYPLYTRFTNRPNRRAATPPPGRHPFAPDLSNDVASAHGRLRSYRWANVSQSEDVELTFETRAGQQMICRPVSWYASFTVVLERAHERKIFSLAGAEEEFKAVLDEIIASRAEVALYGGRAAEGCSPETLWVKMR